MLGVHWNRGQSAVFVSRLIEELQIRYNKDDSPPQCGELLAGSHWAALQPDGEAWARARVISNCLAEKVRLKVCWVEAKYVR